MPSKLRKQVTLKYPYWAVGWKNMNDNKPSPKIFGGGGVWKLCETKGEAESFRIRTLKDLDVQWVTVTVKPRGMEHWAARQLKKAQDAK